MIRILSRFAAVALIGLATSCAGPRPAAPPPRVVPPPDGPPRAVPPPGLPVVRSPLVRVLILETGKAVTVTADGARVTALSEAGGVVDEGSLSGALVVSPAGGGLRARQSGRQVRQAPVLEIRPVTEAGFTIDEAPYRGHLVLRRREGGGLMAINILEMDEYLKGVLPAEIGYLGEDCREAYRVQAIAARSYAFSKLDETQGRFFDLRATIMDQVYRGIKGEARLASEAVDGTRGLVGLWNGEPVRAFYSSCCGGHTADIRVGWPWKTPYPYLEGGRDAPGWNAQSYCRDSRHFRWEARWSGAELTRILGRTLAAELGAEFAPFSVLRDISVEGYSRSGRAVALAIVTDTGTWRVEGDRIRWVLRPDSAGGPILRSTLFKLEVLRRRGRVASVSLRGAGNGHGIGMCQTGAIRMARMGMSAEQILLHYYPGIRIERVYE